jgi:hypothetical protein
VFLPEVDWVLQQNPSGSFGKYKIINWRSLMKFRKVKIIIVAFFLTCIYTSISFAGAWVVAEVIKVGAVSSGAPKILLKHVAGSGCTWTGDRWYNPYNQNVRTAIMSVGMASISLDKDVAVYIESCKAGGTISSIFLQK